MVFSFYEYTGMLNEAFGVEDKFGMGKRLFKTDLDEYRKYFTEMHHLSDYIQGYPQYIIKISDGDLNLLHTQELFSLMLLEQFNKVQFF